MGRDKSGLRALLVELLLALLGVSVHEVREPPAAKADHLPEKSSSIDNSYS